MTAREDVSDKRARFEQAQQVIASNGDIDSIPQQSGLAMAREIRRNNSDPEGIPR